VIALSEATGQLVWRFFTTVPGSTWAGHSWATGAGTLWQTPAVDRSLGLLYVNTGNPGPDLNGIHRLGQNLYTDSIVALDIASGQARWAFQEVHHDLWDYDQRDAGSPVRPLPQRHHGSCSRSLQQERQLLHPRSQDRSADLSRDRGSGAEPEARLAASLADAAKVRGRAADPAVVRVDPQRLQDGAAIHPTGDQSRPDGARRRRRL